VSHVCDVDCSCDCEECNRQRSEHGFTRATSEHGPTAAERASYEPRPIWPEPGAPAPAVKRPLGPVRKSDEPREYGIGTPCYGCGKHPCRCDSDEPRKCPKCHVELQYHDNDGCRPAFQSDEPRVGTEAAAFKVIIHALGSIDGLSTTLAAVLAEVALIGSFTDAQIAARTRGRGSARHDAILRAAVAIREALRLKAGGA
jgi:hypothetical protein